VFSVAVVWCQKTPGGFEVKTNFSTGKLETDSNVELLTNRPLAPTEGTIAILLDDIDVTGVSLINGDSIVLTPTVFPLPVGENTLSVYLVNPSGEWLLIKDFHLRVKKRTEGVAGAKTQVESKTKFEFTPNFSLNLKGENNILFFPPGSRPERPRFADTAGQGGFQFGIKHEKWTVRSQFDFAGTSREAEALRFSELGKRASPIDLSSYHVQIENGRFKVEIGHVSFGNQRHLINSFSSRGFLVTVPVGKQNEVIVTALNGSSIVGFDNFLGVTRAKHNVLGVTFAREFIKERPGGLRLEVTAIHGSLLPINGFNQRSITDAEKSFGGAVRLQFTDKKGRMRIDGGVTRSRFTNPPDPSLAQGQTLTPIRPVTRDARFIEVSYDFLQGLKLWKERKLKVTGTFRHEEIQPLFKSVVAFTQADKEQNQFEVTAGFGDINFTVGNLRDRDNLRRIPSILETLGRRHNLVFSLPLTTLFDQSKPNKWLPHLGYTYDHFHQFGAFLPVNGDFRDASQVPDQHSFAHNFSADWTLSEKLRFGYRFNRSFQDNRQPGREKADFLNEVHATTVGTQFGKNVDINFDVSHERATNFEQPQTNGTFRVGTNLTWRDAVVKNLTFNSDFSTTLAGDHENTNRSKNIEFDAQLAYRFEFGKEKFKKIGAQFFVRYANRYGDQFNRLFFLNNLNKTQVFNMGMTFNFF
jgi:hypothetical protein